MRRDEIGFGLGLSAFGGLVLKATLGLEYYVEDVPGPGFLPFWVSLGIIIMGLVAAWRGIRSRPATGEVGKWPEPSGWKRIGFVLGPLAISLLLLETLGFLATIVLFVAVVAFGLKMRSWRVLLPVPVGAALVIYGIFVMWLKVPLPKGILGLFG